MDVPDLIHFFIVSSPTLLVPKTLRRDRNMRREMPTRSFQAWRGEFSRICCVLVLQIVSLVRSLSTDTPSCFLLVGTMVPQKPWPTIFQKTWTPLNDGFYVLFVYL